MSKITFGYIVGGSTPTASSNILRLNFSTGVTTNSANKVPVTIGNDVGVTN